MRVNVFWLLVTLAFFALFLVFPARFPGKGFRISAHSRLRKLLCIAVISLAALYLMVILIRGRAPEAFSFLGENPIFTLNDSFGSSRGLIWRGSLEMFTEEGFIRKLFGAGPDGFASFLYGDFGNMYEITAPFGGARLTNGHNIYLTELVNIGIFGLAGFFLMIFRFIRAQKELFEEDPSLPLFLFPVCAYLAYGLLNFDMVMNYPYLFVIMGAGEGILRNR